MSSLPRDVSVSHTGRPSSTCFSSPLLCLTPKSSPTDTLNSRFFEPLTNSCIPQAILTGETGRNVGWLTGSLFLFCRFYCELLFEKCGSAVAYTSQHGNIFGFPVLSCLWNAVPFLLHLVNPYLPFKTQLPEPLYKTLAQWRSQSFVSLQCLLHKITYTIILY